LLWQSSVQIDERVFSRFPTRVYHGVEDLAKTIMAPANCRGSRVSLPDIHNSDFAVSEPVYVYTYIIKPNLVGDSYVRLLTPLHFPSPTWYHRFDYSCIDLWNIRIENLSEYALLQRQIMTWHLTIGKYRALLYCTLKRNTLRKFSQFISHHGPLYTALRKSERWR
jgi:hypothetical protein